MRIAICEDLASDRGALQDYIQTYCHSHSYQSSVEVFESAEDLLSRFREEPFDLVFLDIFLPGMDGVEAARQIRALDRDCLLMFITVSEDFSMEGFRVQASGYVVKPLQKEAMDRAMHTCRFLFEKNSRTVDIGAGGDKVRVALSELLYAEASGKQSILYLRKGSISLRVPFRQVEEALGSGPFLRCHRSYIINMNHVRDIREAAFVMANGDAVPISKYVRKEAQLAVVGFKAAN